MASLESYVVSCRAGEFDRTNRKDLSAKFDAFLRLPETTPLVVHFHGGLVTEAAGLDIARQLNAVYAGGGGDPLFYVWQAGLLETLHQSLPQIARESIFQQLLRRILGQVLKRVGIDTRGEGSPEDPEVKAAIQALGSPNALRALQSLDTRDAKIQGPLTEEDRIEFETQLEVDLDFQSAANSAVASLRARTGGESTREGVAFAHDALAQPTLMSPEFASGVGNTRGIVSTAKLIKSAGTVLFRVVQRFLTGRDHGAYTTTVEEILREFYVAAAGTFVWDQLKAHSAAAFGPAPDLHAGTALLHEIQRAWMAGRRRFVLIGHSTGAIWICHLLQKAAEIAPEAQFEVIFLAPACTFELFAATIERHAPRIAQFRLYGMGDIEERQDAMISVLYPRSLLYCVSGILEREPDKPILGMQRYFEDRPPYNEMEAVNVVKRYFETRPKWNVWSVTKDGEVDGFRSGSRAHGDFDNDPITRESLRHIIQTGVGAWPR